MRGRSSVTTPQRSSCICAKRPDLTFCECFIWFQQRRNVTCSFWWGGSPSSFNARSMCSCTICNTPGWYCQWLGVNSVAAPFPRQLRILRVHDDHEDLEGPAHRYFTMCELRDKWKLDEVRIGSAANEGAGERKFDGLMVCFVSNVIWGSPISTSTKKVGTSFLISRIMTGNVYEVCVIECCQGVVVVIGIG